MLASELERLIARKRRGGARPTARRGSLEVFDQINRSLSRAPALRTLLEQEPGTAMQLLTSGAGVVHPRAVLTVEALIVAEVSARRYKPPADPATLAYAIVRLAEAFLYNDAGIRGDHERLREVQAALLGVAARRWPRPSRAARRAPDCRGRA